MCSTGSACRRVVGLLGLGLLGAALAGLAGCGAETRDADAFYVEPLPLQQRKAYSETVTGRFVSLADFEDAPLSSQRGYTQVRHFQIVPDGGGGSLKYVVNITRTGVGGLEVVLPAGASLVYRLPGLHDFSGYPLMMVAIHSPAIRDDFKIRLTTDQASWEGPPVLLKAGWNSVYIDIQRLKRMAGFDARRVRTIRFWFAPADLKEAAVTYKWVYWNGRWVRVPQSGVPARVATGAVRIHLDDIMLIDNQRELTPMPRGVRLFKTGLDYELRISRRHEPIRIRQSDDGLWRLGAEQTVVELVAPGQARKTGGAVEEDLSAFGRRRVGEVEILEANAVRLRLANTWYFPTSTGQWASLAVRKIRWEHAFYADGRCVTDVVLNNAGGKDVSALRIKAPAAAAWSDGTRGAVLEVKRFLGSVGRWGFLMAAGAKRKGLYEANYLKPGGVEIRIGKQEACDGDVDADGFDESQGCYHLRAKDGNCRFLLKPRSEGLADPVIRVSGRWDGPVTASSEGLALRGLVKLPDGDVLFILPGVLSRPRWVEVSGRTPLVGGD